MTTKKDRLMERLDKIKTPAQLADLATDLRDVTPPPNIAEQIAETVQDMFLTMPVVPGRTLESMQAGEPDPVEEMTDAEKEELTGFDKGAFVKRYKANMRDKLKR